MKITKTILLTIIVSFVVCVLTAQAGLYLFRGDVQQLDDTLGSAPVLRVSQGGTGASSFTAGECLVGNGTGAITTAACSAGGSVFSTSTHDYWFDNTTGITGNTGITILGTIATGTWNADVITDAYVADNITASNYLALTTWYSTTTDALSEGSNNLYWTQTRFASALAATTTDALAVGSTNKYYLTSLFASDLAATTTDALSEGSINKYYSDTLVADYIDASSSISKLGQQIDISDETNLVAGTDVTLSGDTLNVDSVFIRTSTTSLEQVIQTGVKRGICFSIASSSPLLSGAIFQVGAFPYAVSCDKQMGDIDSGTSIVYQFTDGTNDATSATATTTPSTAGVSTNNTFTAYEPIKIKLGTVTGSVEDGVFCLYCVQE